MQYEPENFPHTLLPKKALKKIKDAATGARRAGVTSVSLSKTASNVLDLCIDIMKISAPKLIALKANNISKGVAVFRKDSIWGRTFLIKE